MNPQQVYHPVQSLRWIAAAATARQFPHHLRDLLTFPDLLRSVLSYLPRGFWSYLLGFLRTHSRTILLALRSADSSILEHLVTDLSRNANAEELLTTLFQQILNETSPRLHDCLRACDLLAAMWQNIYFIDLRRVLCHRLSVTINFQHKDLKKIFSVLGDGSSANSLLAAPLNMFPTCAFSIMVKSLFMCFFENMLDFKQFRKVMPNLWSYYAVTKHPRDFVSFAIVRSLHLMWYSDKPCEAFNLAWRAKVVVDQMSESLPMSLTNFGLDIILGKTICHLYARDFVVPISGSEEQKAVVFAHACFSRAWKSSTFLFGLNDSGTEYARFHCFRLKINLLCELQDILNTLYELAKLCCSFQRFSSSEIDLLVLLAAFLDKARCSKGGEQVIKTSEDLWFLIRSSPWYVKANQLFCMGKTKDVTSLLDIILRYALILMVQNNASPHIEHNLNARHLIFQVIFQSGISFKNPPWMLVTETKEELNRVLKYGPDTVCFPKAVLMTQVSCDISRYFFETEDSEKGYKLLGPLAVKMSVMPNKSLNLYLSLIHELHILVPNLVRPADQNQAVLQEVRQILLDEKEKENKQRQDGIRHQLAVLMHEQLQKHWHTECFLSVDIHKNPSSTRGCIEHQLDGCTGQCLQYLGRREFSDSPESVQNLSYPFSFSNL